MVNAIKNVSTLKDPGTAAVLMDLNSWMMKLIVQVRKILDENLRR